ncbi:MAG: nucleotidyltransferase family protein [Chloroflexota bacterium]
MIGAVILAAGLSQRMGRPKMTLPWGRRTVIGQVVSVMARAGVEEVRVVTGGAREQVEAALHDLRMAAASIQTVFNPRFAEDHMLLSLQTGLASLPEDVQAALVALGDQPQVQVEVVQAVIQAYQETGAALVVPSYQMRRGHPWLIERGLWEKVLALHPPHTLRDVLNQNAAQIHYLPVETDTVLRDLDTPQEYASQRPQ